MAEPFTSMLSLFLAVMLKNASVNLISSILVTRSSGQTEDDRVFPSVDE
jgi:hypothetical protein